VGGKLTKLSKTRKKGKKNEISKIVEGEIFDRVSVVRGSQEKLLIKSMQNELGRLMRVRARVDLQK
jgi:hypothetical protein